MLKLGYARRQRVAWLGSTAADIASFPIEAKLKLGTALRVVQEGRQHSEAHRGVSTPQHDLDLIAQRLRIAKGVAGAR